MVTLSILDQVPVLSGHSASEAIHEAVALAQAAEQLGYRRFWVAEHHAGVFTCAAPEILVAAIAAHTQHIHVGSGGILLPHYSALKVAETFRLLSSLFPGRIDLGVGRGSGASPAICKALNPSGTPDPLRYEQQVQDLLGFLYKSFSEENAHKFLRVLPDGPEVPEVWMLGSGRSSGEVAAVQGTAFCFAQFFNNRLLPEAIAAYRQCFRPSVSLCQPQASLAVRVLCADSEEEARELALSFWLVCLRAQKKDDLEVECLPAREEALAYRYTEQDHVFMRENRLLMAVGTPDQVKARLLELVEVYEVEELVLSTICPDYRARLRSYQLLAEAFGIGTDANASHKESCSPPQSCIVSET